jgi:hypothetical protein
MAQEPRSFRRVVLGLQPSPPDRSLKFAVELADLLHVELLGLFLEDAGLRHLASIPFARELRPFGGGWQPLDLDRLSREMDLTARATERLFFNAAKRLPTRSQFEVVRGAANETIASISRTDDIFMIAEPRSSVDSTTRQFSSLIDAVLRSSASVMLVPPRPARGAGPVVAVAATPDDPSIDVAATIAVAAGEQVIIVEADGHDTAGSKVRGLGADTGVKIKHLVVNPRALTDPVAFAHALHDVQERLVVVSRGVMTDEMARSVVASRRLPMLIVEDVNAPRVSSVSATA